MIQVINVEDAVGHALLHDITEIRPGEFKGPAFRKGQIIRQEDIAHLQRLGKDHLYISNGETEMLHEDEAVTAMAKALCGTGVYFKDVPSEGKIRILAKEDGLLKVDTEALFRFNEIGEVMCATMHGNTVVKQNDIIAATRAIPLFIEKNTVDRAVEIGRNAGGILKIVPMKKAKAGVMITGNEVYYGRIQDKFEKVIRKKVTTYGGEIVDVVFLPDDDAMIASAAHELMEKGADVIITTGGMSVDPDDRTRFGLLKAGARDLIYGAAALPGAMFMYATLNGAPVLGIPACGMYATATVFDLVYPRVLAGESITRKTMATLGHGGLCLRCKVCHFPECPFGKV
jgi:hypothetical protein